MTWFLLSYYIGILSPGSRNGHRDRIFIPYLNNGSVSSLLQAKGSCNGIHKILFYFILIYAVIIHTNDYLNLEGTAQSEAKNYLRVTLGAIAALANKNSMMFLGNSF